MLIHPQDMASLHGGVDGHLQAVAPSVLIEEARTLPQRLCQGPTASQLAGLSRRAAGVTRVSQARAWVQNLITKHSACIEGRLGVGWGQGEVEQQDNLDSPCQAGEQSLPVLGKHKPEGGPGLKTDI